MGEGNAWALLKRKLKRNRIPGVRFHEIIAVTEMGERQGSTETKNDFLLAPKKKKDRRRQIYQGLNTWAIV